MSQSHHITIYTDGASSPQFDPVPGGWAAILVAQDKTGEVIRERELSGSEIDTTNNRMELMACIAGLEALRHAAVVTVVTDSQYVQRGITEWIHGWFKRNWRNSRGGEVANRDLWQRLYDLTQAHRVTWQWVRGHDGHEYNEMADALAVQAKQSVMETA